MLWVKTKPYSEGLRSRIVRAVEEQGISQPIVAGRFAVSLSSVTRSVRRYRATGTLAAATSPGRPRAVAAATHAAVVAQLTVVPRRHARRSLRGMAEGDGDGGRPQYVVSPGAVRGVVAQQTSLIARERDVEARAAWREGMATVPAGRLVFVGESGFHTQMTPLYACAPRGVRTCDKGYDSRKFRQSLHTCGIRPYIPPKRRSKSWKPRQGRPVKQYAEEYRQHAGGADICVAGAPAPTPHAP